MNNTLRIIPIAAFLSAFVFAGCAVGGGPQSGGGFGATSKQSQSSEGTPCPPGSIFQNGQCVAYGGGK